MQNPNNETIYAYLGIPYAAPPVGQLRFQPPQQYDGWGGQIWNGTVQPHACAQFLTNVTIAEEDCLFVSVYTRRRPSETANPLPVMFWIHGGGLVFGQTSYYTGHKLLAEDVVLVSVQYRLGPLGFLSSGEDGVIPGNNGMKDTVQALRWVQENIASFGGDPNQVTVFGESAGAASSIYMLTSPLARGLFHQVAAMSGSRAVQKMGRSGQTCPGRTVRRAGRTGILY
jgi:carboxylesterase type B